MDYRRMTEYKYEPHECPHNLTVIYPNEDGSEKIENCKECGSIIKTWTLRAEHQCGSEDTASGEPCQRTVSTEDATCWQH